MTTTETPPPQPSPQQQSTRRLPLWRLLLPYLLILVGAGVGLYVVLATQVNNLSHERVAAAHREEVAAAREATPDTLERGLAAAREYNATRPQVPVSDPWTASEHNPDNPEYAAYLAELNDFTAMSTVTIPGIDSSLPLYHGTAPETLNDGLGHLYGSSLPVGGAGTHAVLTGHTGIRTATMWDRLVDVEVGDEVFVETYGETMKYRVYDTAVVLPEDTEAIMFNDANRELLTLITCTPYGVNSHRLLVHAERVPMAVEEQTRIEEAGGLQLSWWMWTVLVIAALAVIFVIVQIIRLLRARR